MSRCGDGPRPGCGAAITWGTTEAGKAMPLDAVATDDGTWVILPGGLARKATDEDKRLLRPMHVPHWATCPNAQKFRGKK